MPETNGMVERFNGLLNQQLRAFAIEKGSGWLQALPMLEFSLNARPLIRSVSPFVLTYGFHPRTPADVELGVAVSPGDEAPKVLVNRLRDEFLEFARGWDDRQGVEDVTHVARFEVGDWVLLNTARHPQLTRGIAHHFKPSWIGPYKVVHVVSPQTFKLEMHRGYIGSSVFHSFLLKPYFGAIPMAVPADGQTPSVLPHVVSDAPVGWENVPVGAERAPEGGPGVPAGEPARVTNNSEDSGVVPEIVDTPGTGAVEVDDPLVDDADDDDYIAEGELDRQGAVSGEDSFVFRGVPVTAQGQGEGVRLRHHPPRRPYAEVRRQRVDRGRELRHDSMVWRQRRRVLGFKRPGEEWFREEPVRLRPRLGALSKDDVPIDRRLLAEALRTLDVGSMAWDMFASRSHHVCPQFVISPQEARLCPGYRGEVDAFSLPWGRKRGLFFNPPWKLLGRVLTKLKAEGGRGVVVAPLWPEAPFWKLLVSMSVKMVELEGCVFFDDFGRRRPVPPWRTVVAFVDARRRGCAVSPSPNRSPPVPSSSRAHSVVTAMGSC
jgi:hypothetical protein